MFTDRCLLIAAGLTAMTFVTALAGPTPVRYEMAKLRPSDAASGGGVGFGSSVAASGDYLAVGAPLDSTLAQFSGAVYVFRRNDQGTPLDPTDDTWMEEAKLVASDGGFNDELGFAVAIDGDRVVAGAPEVDIAGSDFGRAYDYRRDPGGWVQEQKLISSGSVEGDGFGYAVSISGELIVVGAPWEKSFRGRAYVFRREETTWVEEAALSAANPQPETFFGRSLGLESNLLVVGDGNDDAAGTDAGAVYVFRNDGITWRVEDTLTTSDGAPYDAFGISVGIEADRLAGGATGATGLEPGAGAVYVFSRASGAWLEEAKLAPSDGNRFDALALSVAVSGTHLVVAARGDDHGGEDSGSAYLFQRFNTEWHEAAKLLASDARPSDRLGTSVAVTGPSAIAGSFSNLGAVYVYTLADIPPPIPALSRKGIAVFALLLLLSAIVVLRNRARRRGSCLSNVEENDSCSGLKASSEIA